MGESWVHQWRPLFNVSEAQGYYQVWKSKAIGRVCEVLLGVEGLNTKVCALEGVELFGFNKQ